MALFHLALGLLTWVPVLLSSLWFVLLERVKAAKRDFFAGAGGEVVGSVIVVVGARGREFGERVCFWSWGGSADVFGGSSPLRPVHVGEESLLKLDRWRGPAWLPGRRQGIDQIGKSR